MNILMINSVFSSGSTGKIVYDIKKYAEEKGFNVYVIYGFGRKSLEPHTYKCSGKLEYYVTNLLCKITGYDGHFAFSSTNRVIKLIKRIKPDIVHLHNIHGYYLNYKMLFNYLKKIDVKVLWTLHDCWSFTGRCAYYSYNKCEKWQNGCYECKFISSYPKSIIFDASAKIYNEKSDLFRDSNIKFITVSKWLERQAKLSFLSKENVKTIYNGVDESIFNISKPNIIKNNKKIILGVSNVWNDKKGFNDFIKLSKIISDEYMIILVGLSKNQIKRIPSNIIGIQRTNSREELVELYNSAYVFLNLSYEETFGMVTLEALLCGIPCIVYNQTAVPELICEPFGCVVSAGDYISVYQKIKNKCFAKKDDIRRYALQYKKEIMVRGYVEQYEKCY